MKHKALNLVIACAMMTSVAAQAAGTFETRDTRTVEEARKSDEATKKALGTDETSGRDVVTTVHDSTEGNKRSDTVSSKGKSMLELAGKNTEKSTAVVDSDINAVVATGQVEGLFLKTMVTKATHIISDIKKENPYNYAEVTKAIRDAKKNVKADGTLSEGRRKIVLAYMDMIHALHQTRVKLSADNIAQKEADYDGSKAATVYAEILEGAARKIEGKEVNDDILAIHEAEVKILMERKNMTKEEAENAAYKLEKNGCTV